MNVDIDRIRSHVEAIARFTSTPGQGATRMTYSPEYRAGCDYLLGEAARLGLESRLDAVGNVRIRLPGTDPAAPAVVVGSHIDSVRHGGDFDGVLGVVCGLEALEVLVQEEIRPLHSIELISFIEEEAGTFACPLAGSKAVAGQFEVEDLHHVHDETGRSLHERAREFGADPDNLVADRLQPGSVKAMLELHIEQSPLLESEGMPVGIVDSIAGSETCRLRLEGVANHAGTTPMSQRRDALAAAAGIVQAVEQVATASERTSAVATVGRIQCHPNAGNVIPGRVDLSLDVRDVRRDDIDAMVRGILSAAETIAAERHVSLHVDHTGGSLPRPFSRHIVDRMTAIAERDGIPYRHMHSGALHDAATFTDITDVAMLFVPSRDGRSHVPEEWTDWKDIEPGANLLLATLHDLAVDGEGKRTANERE